MPRKIKPYAPGTKMTKRQVDNARLAISTSKIVARLQDNFNGLLDEQLSPSQLKSAELLISRSLPVLSATEVTEHAPDMGDPLDSKKALEELVQQYLKDPTKREEVLELVGLPNLLCEAKGLKAVV